MIVGPIANKISTKYDMDKPRMTSLIDIVSCVTQGLLPYGGQVLILVTLLENQADYLQLVTHSFYISSLFLVIFLSFVSYHRNHAKLKMSIDFFYICSKVKSKGRTTYEIIRKQSSHYYRSNSRNWKRNCFGICKARRSCSIYI